MNIYKVAMYYYDTLPENDSYMEEINTQYFKSPIFASVYAENLVKEHHVEYTEPKDKNTYPVIYQNLNYGGIEHIIKIEEIRLSD